MNGFSPTGLDDDRSGPVRFERVGRHDRVGIVISALVVAFLVLAIAKPWAPATSSTAPAPSSRPSTVARLATPTASPRLIALASSDDACATSLWWATIVEGPAGRELRSWYRVQPIATGDERGTTIPTVRLYASAAWALGFCVAQSETRRGVVGVRAWRMDGTTPTKLALARLDAVSPVDPDLGGLYAPPDLGGPGGGSSPAAWAPGRYVFEVEFARPASSSAWFAIDVIQVRETSLDIGANVRSWLPDMAMQGRVPD